MYNDWSSLGYSPLQMVLMSYLSWKLNSRIENEFLKLHNIMVKWQLMQTHIMQTYTLSTSRKLILNSYYHNHNHRKYFPHIICFNVYLCAQIISPFKFHKLKKNFPCLEHFHFWMSCNWQSYIEIIPPTCFLIRLSFSIRKEADCRDF